MSPVDFDQYIKEEIPVYSCANCGRTYTEEVKNLMDGRNVPCPCGEQPDDLSEVDGVLDPATADVDDTMTWDQVVDQIARSGFWRCTHCELIAPEGDWDSTCAGDESFVTCPRCEQIENYEILRVEGE